MDDKRIMGSALVNAARAEKKAEFPRIMIDPIVFDDFNPRMITLINNVISKEDGNNYIDVFNYIQHIHKLSNEREDEKLSRILKKLAKEYLGFIKKVISNPPSNPTPRISMKFIWLENKYCAIEKILYN